MVKYKRTVIKCKKKPHYMIFSLSRERIINDTDIRINGQMMAHVTCTKFIGVLIDEKLSWANHNKSIKKKILQEKGTGISNKGKKYINLSILVPCTTVLFILT